MRLTSTKYYWLICGGLFLVIALSLPIALFEETITGNSSLTIGFALLALFPAMCHLTVLLFMWDEYQYWLVLVLSLILVLAATISPAFLAVIVLGPMVYWVFQYRVYLDRARDT